jgi:hypothetical protein
MKNFLELLDTKFTLEITVNGNTTTVALNQLLTFDADDHVTVDEIEILPHWRHLTNDHKLIIQEPFYNWYHRISGQGWLLVPT